MSKTKIIEEMQAQGLSKAEAERQFGAVISGISATVRGHGKATIPEFGTFEIRNMAARQTRNPRTGETITVSERQALKFRASKHFAI